MRLAWERKNRYVLFSQDTCYWHLHTNICQSLTATSHLHLHLFIVECGHSSTALSWIRLTAAWFTQCQYIVNRYK